MSRSNTCLECPGGTEPTENKTACGCGPGSIWSWETRSCEVCWYTYSCLPPVWVTAVAAVSFLTSGIILVGVIAVCIVKKGRPANKEESTVKPPVKSPPKPPATVEYSVQRSNNYKEGIPGTVQHSYHSMPEENICRIQPDTSQDSNDNIYADMVDMDNDGIYADMDTYY